MSEREGIKCTDDIVFLLKSKDPFERFITLAIERIYRIALLVLFLSGRFHVTYPVPRVNEGKRRLRSLLLYSMLAVRYLSDANVSTDLLFVAAPREVTDPDGGPAELSHQLC